MQLHYNPAGPYTARKTINKNAYTLDLPKTMRNHNVFHMSLLDRYTPPTIGQPSTEPHPVIVDNWEEWELDRILDSKRRYRKLHYLIQWAGYSHLSTSCEPAVTLEVTGERVEEFHRKHPRKPRCDGTNWTTSFPCLFLLLDTGPVQMVSAWVVPPRIHDQLEVGFPRAPDPPKARPNRYQSVVGLACFVYLSCGISLLDLLGCLVVCLFAFILFLHVWDHAAQEFCTKRGE